MSRAFFCYDFLNLMKKSSKNKKASQPKKAGARETEKAQQEKEREQVMRQLEALGYIG